ncbi:hypothetical protein DFS34DRAFT_649882 [Phlyctochytrium arcticum]|nr:hypothetical protein DFS34DRAFT_649882 [Phlyctochytrium arcticum]
MSIANPPAEKLGLRKQLKKGITTRLRSISSPPVPTFNTNSIVINSSGSTIVEPATAASTPGSPQQSARFDAVPNASFLTLEGVKRSTSGPSVWLVGRARAANRQKSAISLAEFRQTDTHPRKQRRLLKKLEVRKPVESQAQNKNSKWKTSMWESKNKKVDKYKDDKKGVLSKLLKAKKDKRTAHGTLHLIRLAVHDHRMTTACALLEYVNAAVFGKFAAETERIFLSAMVNGMEPVCMLMMDKGFPSDANAAVCHEGASQPRFQTPSYFLLAVCLGLHRVVFKMIQSQKIQVNSSWFGITALHIACCKGSLSLVRILLESGAKPRVALSVQEYQMLRRLRSLQRHSKKVSKSTTKEPKAQNRQDESGGDGAEPSRSGKQRAVTDSPTVTSDTNGKSESTSPRKQVLDPDKAICDAFRSLPPGEGILPVDFAAVYQYQEIVTYLLNHMKPAALSPVTLSLLAVNDMHGITP